MEFKKKLQARLYIAVSYIVIGLLLIAADALNHFENQFFFSFGITLIVMGILRLLRYRKVTKDDASIHRQEVVETDERTLMMAEKARSWAFSYSILIAGIAVIVLSLLGKHDTAQPFAWYVCGQIGLYWICWLILRKKY
jgi:uncharacterized membrane protein